MNNDIDKSSLDGSFAPNVDLKESIRPTPAATDVIRTENGWLFPEDVHIHNDKDQWLYAFGKQHVWRTADVEKWELVR